jgi:hypothetical protein
MACGKDNGGVVIIKMDEQNDSEQQRKIFFDPILRLMVGFIALC